MSLSYFLRSILSLSLYGLFAPIGLFQIQLTSDIFFVDVDKRVIYQCLARSLYLVTLYLTDHYCQDLRTFCLIIKYLNCTDAQKIKMEYDLDLISPKRDIH